jgi:2-methylcitrate dehydratase PrpD
MSRHFDRNKIDKKVDHTRHRMHTRLEKKTSSTFSHSKKNPINRNSKVHERKATTAIKPIPSTAIYRFIPTKTGQHREREWN